MKEFENSKLVFAATLAMAIFSFIFFYIILQHYLPAALSVAICILIIIAFYRFLTRILDETQKFITPSVTLAFLITPLFPSLLLSFSIRGLNLINLILGYIISLVAISLICIPLYSYWTKKGVVKIYHCIFAGAITGASCYAFLCAIITSYSERELAFFAGAGVVSSMIFWLISFGFRIDGRLK